MADIYIKTLLFGDRDFEYGDFEVKFEWSPGLNDPELFEAVVLIESRKMPEVCR